MILLDSNHFSVLLDERDVRQSALRERLDEVFGEVALPIVVVEETMRGWLSAIHKTRQAHKQIDPYRRLAKFIDCLRDWQIIGWDEEAANRFDEFRRKKVRIGTADLKIGSIALAHDAIVLSANLRDFQQVPGLHVEDWPGAA